MVNEDKEKNPIIRVEGSGTVATAGAVAAGAGGYAAGGNIIINNNQQPNKSGVFISYSHIDGEVVAAALRKLLKEKEQDIVLVNDLNALVDKRDVTPRMILIVTPEALKSRDVREDWQYARQESVCIYLVEGVQGIDLYNASLPNWMRKSYIFNLDTEKEKFLNCLKDPCYVARAPSMAPHPPQKYVFRSEKFEQLFNCFLDAHRVNPLPSTTVALYGPEGFGKTALAECLCQHETIINAFDGGILWMKLGENPNLEEEMTKLYRALIGESPKGIDGEGRFLKRRLEGKNCLIVIDDVWNEENLAPLLNGVNCARLITTPKFLYVTGIKRINVDEMTQDEAVEVLAARVGYQPQFLEPLCNLAERCGRMPLMLGLAGAALYRHIEGGYTLDEAISHMNRSLDEKGVVVFDRYKTIECNKAITQTIEVNLKLLTPEQQDRYIDLAVFPEGTDIPISILGVLWGLQIFETEELCEEFNDLSLLNYDMQARTVRLHKVFKCYLIGKVNDLKNLHARVASGIFTAWKKDCKTTGNDPTMDYSLKYIFSHLIFAQCWNDLKKLLIDIEYLKMKQDPAEQYNFQKDFKILINSRQIPLDELINILEECLNAISEKLEIGNEKSDLLNTFSYWINEFNDTDNIERRVALKGVARKFDHACAVVSRELANRYLKEGKNDWALRFAELIAWIYQRVEDYSRSVEACRFAEEICLHEDLRNAYRHPARAEFIRLRARALSILAKTDADKGAWEQYAAQAGKAYEELNEVLASEQPNSWELTVEDWKKLEKHSEELLIPRSMLDMNKKKFFKVKVVSNAHDCISAIYIIRFLEAYGASVEWVHPKKYQPEYSASHDIQFIILIGSPRAPGMASLADTLYEKNKESFLKIYSAKEMVDCVLKIEQGNTIYYWVAGPFKPNTLMAAYKFIHDQEVINSIKHLLKD
jgi:hypothetical protein